MRGIAENERSAGTLPKATFATRRFRSNSALALAVEMEFSLLGGSLVGVELLGVALLDSSAASCNKGATPCCNSNANTRTKCKRVGNSPTRERWRNPLRASVTDKQTTDGQGLVSGVGW